MMTQSCCAEHTLDFIVTNAATESDVALHTGSTSDTALMLVNAQGFKDLNIWHPVNLYGAPADFAQDFVVMGPTTIARPVECARAQDCMALLDIQ